MFHSPKYSIPLLLLLTSFPATLGARIEDLIEQPPSDFSSSSSSSSSADSSPNSSSGLVWQPLRATFRPLNRQSSNGPPPPPPPPFPLFPAQPSLNSAGDPLSSAGTTDFDSFSSDISRPSFGSGSAFQPTLSPTSAATTSTTTTTTTSSPPPALITTPAFIGGPNTTPAPLNTRSVTDDDFEDQPTRVPLNRFRPTKAPSVDPQSQPSPVNLFAASGNQNFNNNGSSSNLFNLANQNYRITNECFECICEASTNCNPNSRCQTSDVRHTRCGMLLISYDQWLETGLSRQLVTREALARDAAADERAFYDCVTDRECAERLMSIYMQKNARDCDKDGRIDCYDVAAIHQGGIDQCSSENLLDSQYWSDFNACFGFGR